MPDLFDDVNATYLTTDVVGASLHSTFTNDDVVSKSTSSEAVAWLEAPAAGSAAAGAAAGGAAAAATATADMAEGSDDDREDPRGPGRDEDLSETDSTRPEEPDLGNFTQLVHGVETKTNMITSSQLDVVGTMSRRK